METTSTQIENLNQLTRSNEIEWQPFTEPAASGVSFKVLRFDKETRRAPTLLLKFEAGGTFPAHNHPGGEEVFVCLSVGGKVSVVVYSGAHSVRHSGVGRNPGNA